MTFESAPSAALRALAIALVASSCLYPAYAQQTVELETILVEGEAAGDGGSLLSPSAQQAVKAIDRTPGSVEIVPAPRDLRRNEIPLVAPPHSFESSRTSAEH